MTFEEPSKKRMATSDSTVEKSGDDVKGPITDGKSSTGISDAEKAKSSATEEPETDQGGLSGAEKDMKSVTESKEKAAESASVEEENDQKQDKNQKPGDESCSVLGRDPEVNSEENIEETKESSPCVADLKETENTPTDQNSQQSDTSVDKSETCSKEQEDILLSKPEDVESLKSDNVECPKSDDINSSKPKSVNSSKSQIIKTTCKPDTHEENSEEKTSTTSQDRNEEMVIQNETSEIQSQKAGDEKETATDKTTTEQLEQSTELKDEQNGVIQEEECTDKEKNIEEEKSESKPHDTDKIKLDQKDITNCETSEKQTEQQSSEKMTAGDEGENENEIKTPKESDIQPEERKSGRPVRGQRSRTVLDSKGQGQIKSELLTSVTKSMNDASNLTLKDEKTVNTEESNVVVDQKSEKVLNEENTNDAEVNISDTSILDESVNTDRGRVAGFYKAYKCKGCKYSTHIKTNLRRHASINIDYKPFLCNLCGNKFTDKSTLNFHNKKRHSGAENFGHTPEKVKDKALDRYLEMCTNIEGKVKSPEMALRNPAKYKDCNLDTFDLFKDFKNANSKKHRRKEGTDSAVDGDGGPVMDKNSIKKTKIMKSSQTNTDDSLLEASNDVSSPSEPRRRGPGRRKKTELESFPVVSSTGNISQVSPGNVSLNSPVINQSSPTPVLTVPHPGTVMSFGGIAIPVSMQMPMQIPIQLSAQMPTPLPSQIPLQPQTPDQAQMASTASQSQPAVIESDPSRQVIENDKKKGRKKTIREILNLDNGVRRQKLTHGQILEAKSSVRGAKFFGLKAGRGRGRRRGSSRSFAQIETDQSSTDNSVPESEVSGSEGDPSWPEPVSRKRGRPSGRSRGIVPLRRKYMRMKLVGTLTDHYAVKSRRASNTQGHTEIEETLVETEEKKIELEPKETDSEMEVSLDRKNIGRKRKIDCVADPVTGGIEKQRKMASETGILTEETINNSLLALKRRQDNITATSDRVKRKYVRRTKNLTMPAKRTKTRATSNSESSLLSISNTSSTMEEQRDLNETGMSASAIQTPEKPEKRKRGRPRSEKKEEVEKTYIRGQYKKRLPVVSQENVGEQVVHSGCDKCPLEEISDDGKRTKVIADPGKANCETAGDGENVEISKTSVKKPTHLKSTRMKNYVKKYSQKYSNLAKAKYQGKVISKSKDQHMIKCPLCEYQSKSINGVRLHAFWVHKMCKYSCAECPYFTLNRFEGLAHYKEEHPGKTVALVRSFCLLKDLEEDTTPGQEGKVLTLSFSESPSKQPVSESPSKQHTPGKVDVYDYNESSESSPSKSPGAPDITGTVMEPLAIDRDKMLKARCPKCSFISTVRGVNKHLMMAHATENWVCGECKFMSPSKTLTIQHARRNHKGMQPKVCRTAISVEPDPELNLKFSTPRGCSTPKASKDSTEVNMDNSDLSPTMPKLKKFPKTWQMKLESIKDRENLQQLIAKRKGKIGKVKTAETPAAEDSSPSYTLHPRKMESLNVGFSCVYCYYSAPLRHQLHLHCYDKHTNHPACLMKFTKDSTVLDFLGEPAGVNVAEKLLKSDICKKETVSDKEHVQRIIKWNNDQDLDIKDGICEKGEIIRKEDNSLDIKYQNVEQVMESSKECKINSDFGVLSVKPHKQILSHSSTKSDNSDPASTKTDCPTSKRMMSSKAASSKTFLNPLTPLVTSLGASQVKLHDTFHSSLDDLDTVLSNFGVRTLNMDMLTRKQFTDFIHRFGNSLQQM